MISKTIGSSFAENSLTKSKKDLTAGLANIFARNSLSNGCVIASRRARTHPREHKPLNSLEALAYSTRKDSPGLSSAAKRQQAQSQTEQQPGTQDPTTPRGTRGNRT